MGRLKNNNKLVTLLWLAMTSSLCMLTTTNSQSTTTRVKAAYWFKDSGFPLSSINTTLFTHLFCAFADLNPSTNRVTVSSANSASFAQFTPTLRATNPALKTLMSIGGGSSSPSTFSSMAASASSRKSFIDSSIAVARNYSFLGLDLDYEYPSTTSDMTNYASLLSEWRSAISAEASASSRPPLLLTAAVFYRSDYYTIPYPASTMASSLDFLNLMAYDFWGPLWSTVTRPASALYDASTGVSGSAGVAAWIASGVPAAKLVLGLPFYGYAYTLSSATNNGYNSPTTGPAMSSDGSVTYQGIKQYLAANTGVTTVYNSGTVESYSYKGTTWITYDDVQAVATKMTYIKQGGLLGYFAWHVGADNNFALATTAANSLN